MKIKKGDVVIILSGKERGNTGRVLKVDSKHDRIFVEGRNIVRRHQRANGAGVEAGIISKEAGIHRSNIALYSETLKRGVRVCMRFEGKEGALFTSKIEALKSLDGSAEHVNKVRYCVKTGEVFK